MAYYQTVRSTYLLLLKAAGYVHLVTGRKCVHVPFSWISNSSVIWKNGCKESAKYHSSNNGSLSDDISHIGTEHLVEYNWRIVLTQVAAEGNDYWALNLVMPDVDQFLTFNCHLSRHCSIHVWMSVSQGEHKKTKIKNFYYKLLMSVTRKHLHSWLIMPARTITKDQMS